MQKPFSNSSETCPLCQSTGVLFYESKHRVYYECNNCKGLFVPPHLVPNANDEQNRYEEHHNDVENPGYQKFVSPITSAILKDYTSKDKGLDFGAGTGPVITKVLNESNYHLKLYDPFFHNNPEVLKEKYNYIACCEVIEHFHYPKKEFFLLKTLLKEKGTLYCLTDIYDETIDFHKWYYKNDATHVFIYQKETLEWIKETIGFSKMEIDGRLIKFYVS